MENREGEHEGKEGILVPTKLAWEITIKENEH